MKDTFKNDSPVLLGQSNGRGVILSPRQGHTSLSRLGVEKERAPQSQFYRAIGKRVLDIAIVLVSLPIVLPLVILCAIALWAESGLPFYRQARLGRSGKTFSILKLRTMVRDADTLLAYYLDNDPAMRAEWMETQKLKNDPRITKVGRFLRATSLDELPQLWNVLKGDMSLVGPRPMMPEQLSLYGGASAYFSVRPGLTGIWQVSARNESAFAMRNTMDREYCHSLSLWKDLSLIQRTFGVVLRGTGY
ncbi:sugar transferase [Epibacterium ulvae]|uniref:sugar transferase n=1 Tax=Epibacterium ulvae TaxID=1156985 RepID=UPI00249052C0|nr:sugar transferase [Epibacterium ulvae]